MVGKVGRSYSHIEQLEKAIAAKLYYMSVYIKKLDGDKLTKSLSYRFAIRSYAGSTYVEPEHERSVELLSQ